VAISYTKITPFDTAFSLVRTNPKLTGNVKLIVNSSQSLFFESIDAAPELAKDKYKAYPIDPTSQHDTNLYKYFSNGNTPESIVFAVKTSVSPGATSSNFADQYDFSEYFAGARYCSSKSYSEKFKYFAPLYLNKDLPEKFVIFKIPGSSNLPISQTKAAYPYNKTAHLKNILDNAQIIKTFDLGVDSRVGKYIRKMQSNPQYPSDTLNFPFNKGRLAAYSGIAYKAGCYTEKFENLQDLIIGGKTLTDFEEYVTLGYERNALIYPYILNLEFLFDDTSDDFKFNRYFGIYCNTVDLLNLDFDLSDHAALGLNAPTIIDPNIYEYAQLPFVQNNNGGLDLKFHSVPTAISTALSSLDGAGILALEDKAGNLHKIKSSDSTNLRVKISTESLDISLLHGPTEIFLEDKADYTKSGIKSFIEIKLKEVPNHLDKIRIYYPNGKNVNQNSKGFETITAVSNFSYNGSPLIGALAVYDQFGPDQFFYSCDKVYEINETGISVSQFAAGASTITLSTANALITVGCTVSGTGLTDGQTIIAKNGNTLTLSALTTAAHGGTYSFTKEQAVETQLISIADSIAKSVNAIQNSGFTAYSHNNRIFIIVNTQGNVSLEYAAQYIPSTDSPKILISGNEIYKKSAAVLLGNSNTTQLNLNTSDYIVYGEAVPSINQVSYPIGSLIADSGIKTLSFGLGNLDQTFLIGCPIVNFEPGTDARSHISIDGQYFKKIQANKDDILVQATAGWVEIENIVKSIDYINQSAFNTEAEKIAAVTYYDNKISVLTEQGTEPLLKFGLIQFKKKFKPAVSALSIIPIKDFDFNKIDSQYAAVQLSDIWKSSFIPEGINMINLGKSAYRVLNGSLKIENVTYNDGDLIEKSNTPKIVSFTKVTGDPFVIPAISLTAPTYDVELAESNPDILDFKGFFTITSDYAEVSPNKTNSYIYRDKFTSGKISSEYDSNYERYLIENAGKNRLVNYICKWGADGSLDARSNPYRLNSDTVFGVNNFSPDPNKVEPESSSMTHEWFYIESLYDYVNDITAAAQNKLYFDTPFDLQAAVTQPGYFEDYFIFTPAYLNSGISTPCARTQYRFSQIKNDRLTGLAKTIFKGVKFVFKEVVPSSVEKEISGALKYVREASRFKGYRFSAILKVIEDNPYSGENPIKFNFIESRDFRFITLVVELRLNHRVPALTSIVPNTGNPKSLVITKTGNLLPNEQHVFNNVSSSFADYKLNRTQIGNLAISDITLAFMYYAKHKKYNTLNTSYSSINLVNSLDLSRPTNYGDRGLPFVPTLDKGTGIQIVDEISQVKNDTMLSYKDEASVKTVAAVYPENFTLEFPVDVPEPGQDTPGQSLNPVSLPGGTTEGITTTETNTYGAAGTSIYPFIKNGIIASNSVKSSTVNQPLIVGSTLNPAVTASVEGGSSTVVLSSSPATPILSRSEIDIAGWTQFATSVVALNGTTITISKPIKSNIKIQNHRADTTNGSSNIQLVTGVNYDIENFGNAPINETGILVSQFAAGASTITLSTANANVIVGCTVSGTGIAAGTTITGKAGLSLTLSTATTAQSSGTYTFTRTWPNYSDSNKVYVTGTGIPSNTYVIRIDNTELDANGEPRPLVKLSANATASGVGVTVRFFQKNTAAAVNFYPSDIKHAIAVQSRVLEVGGTLSNVIDILELKNATTGELGYTTPNAQLFNNETNSTFGILPYPGNGNTDKRLLRIIDQIIYRLDNQSGISEILPTGVVMSSDFGIGEITFAKLPFFEIENNAPVVKFNDIITRALAIPAFDLDYWQTKNFALLLGGESYYSGLFKRLSFAEFKRSLERGASNITYTTYSNGVKTTGEFYIEIEEATLVEKLKLPTVTPVNIQLTQAKTSGNKQDSNLVGYTATESYLQNPIFLRRHGATYSPIFREVTAFMPDTLLNSEMIKDANCKFNPAANRFFEVKGFEHIKVSENKILDLEGSDKYSPTFELIGEIPVSTGDLYLLASNWDYGFHLEYINKMESIPAYGTRRIAEDSYFMAKLVSLPDLIEVDDLTSKEVTEFPKISDDYINRGADILYKVNKVDSQIDINLTNTVAAKVMNLGLATQIQESFGINIAERNPEILGSYDFNSYVKRYAIENILPNYAIDQLNLWYLEDKGEPTTLEIVQKTAADRLALGYKKLEGAQINIKNGLAVQLIIPLKTTGKISLAIEPKMKFI